ncbi:MAG: hypothetical protein IJS09_04705 [Treponema sp.]|nr:hypothetical protein [Treponema sp.]
MGLLSYIDTMEQQGPGLLARAEQYCAEGAHPEESHPGNFYEWCKKYNFSKVALLQHDETHFFITKSIGFDAESIALSYSSKDFWEGTLVTNGSWQSFTQGTTEIGSFNQFFSEQMLSMISKLHFIKLDDCILLIVQEEESASLPDINIVKKELIQLVYVPTENTNTLALEEAIKKGLTISSANLYFLSIKSAVSTAIKDVPFPDEKAKGKMTDIIYAHIEEICKTLFQTPNCTQLGNNGEIKIVFFSKDEIDEQLLQFHITQTLADMVGKDATSGIVLLMAGICSNIKGTMTFLQQG